ncbi:MAG TPA: rod shape-determining protein MreC, partial [Epsilonproteobacteria bacterium]|nr:rod shape-determining protein MreC [Campylobacterota bacterium]
MKTRLVIIAILLLILTVLLSRNDERITDTLLNIINPIKQNYQNFTQGIEDKSHSYIFQKESIEKLSRENRILRKRLLEQTHYIQQVRNIYSVLPDLSKLPIHNISISETISYVKLNSFSQIILTKPKDIKDDKLYGLIQGEVVAGIAELRNNQLYGYLTSDNKCRFSVFIGEQNAPGIATGVSTNEMIIKFIPKWHKIKKGDKVITSGLDDIFFADIPVGVVTKIEIQSSYKVAHIRTYSDIYHPKTFFLINDAKATIAENFDSNDTKLK